MHTIRKGSDMYRFAIVDTWTGNTVHRNVTAVAAIYLKDSWNDRAAENRNRYVVRQIEGN